MTAPGRRIDSLYRYPVKGLSPQSLDEVVLRAGFGFPLDRAYAISDGSWRLDPKAPKPMPKGRFLMLAKHERLASIRTELDESTHVLSATRGATTVRFELRCERGRRDAARYFAEHSGAQTIGTPEIVFAEGMQFTDSSVHSVAMMRSISLINLESVRALACALDGAVDPLRFRGNLLFSGGEPWEEFDWLDREIDVGEATVRVVRRIKRCAATNVDLVSARRDRDIPVALHRAFGHGDLGVYAEVVRGGAVRAGAAVVPR